MLLKDSLLRTHMRIKHNARQNNRRYITVLTVYVTLRGGTEQNVLYMAVPSAPYRLAKENGANHGRATSLEQSKLLV